MSEGLVWLTKAVVCLLAAPRHNNTHVTKAHHVVESVSLEALLTIDSRDDVPE